MVCPALIVLSGGDAATEKSAKNTDKAMVAVWEPLVPVTVKSTGFGLDADRPVTVTTLLCPPVIVDGLNEQVTPEEVEVDVEEVEEVLAHVSEILSIKELGADA